MDFLDEFCGLCEYYVHAVVFHALCELWMLELHVYGLVGFVIQFRSFWYIICYFWWVVQGVLV